MANVLVFAETRGGELRKVAFEAVTAARALADATRRRRSARALRGAAGHRRDGAEQLGQLRRRRRARVEHAGLANFAREVGRRDARRRARSRAAIARSCSASRRRAAISARASPRKLDAPIAADVTEIQLARRRGHREASRLRRTRSSRRSQLAGPLGGAVSCGPSAFTAAEAPRSARVETLAPAARSGGRDGRGEGDAGRREGQARSRRGAGHRRRRARAQGGRRTSSSSRISPTRSATPRSARRAR